ncbi:MAG: PQQ-binding-like beta-propeller repeat protein [Bacteroidia bacterium]|nr:PQQ-binding-like beta-propeller repeat protein [Bacteroidia bacterium]
MYRIKSFFTEGSLTVCMAILFVGSGCSQKKNELTWDKSFSGIGSQSSIRTEDINQDGVQDIIMGAGGNEYQHSNEGVLAFDGKSGNILWRQEADDQVFGSATLYDINGDSVRDVFIGGRGPQFRALDGKTGTVLWSYKYQYENDPVLKYAQFNFYNSVLVPDQNQDGLSDLLVVNGGNAKAGPRSRVGRVPGVLMVMDSKTGTILAADTMPDAEESYMSPLCFAQPGSSEYSILFGTGGETFSGNLYIARLTDLMEKKLSNARIVATETGHGFIAPPVLADINQDGFYDIVAISHGSTVFAINGKTEKPLWQKKIPNTESSNSFAVGYFTDDDIPDFFTFVSKGEWPNNTGSLQVMFDGKDGNIAYMDSMGCTGFSSPVVYDIDKDGLDDALISINEFDCNRKFDDQTPLNIVNKLVNIHFQSKKVNTIDQLPGFKNIFSTPWLGDLDNDGYLDIVYCQYYNPSTYLLTFMGMRIKRISSNLRMKEAPRWGGYMGSEGDGIFRGK